MKPIFTLLILAFTFTSCQKKYSYQCETKIYGQSNGAKNIVTKTMSENEKDKYVKSNTVNNDGSDQIFSEGEKITECIKK